MTSENNAGAKAQQRRKISYDTAAFVEAISAITAAEDAVMDALNTKYSTDTAIEMMQQIPFEPVQKAVGHLLYICIEENINQSPEYM